MKPMVMEAAELMIQTMKDLSAKKIDSKDAQVIAQLGIGVVQAANAEVQFIRATKAIPVDGTFGTDMRFIDPPDAKGR
jgi:hypothetical protein